MIESSHKKKRSEESNGVTYRVDEGSVRVYGQNSPRVYGEGVGGTRNYSRRVYGSGPRVEIDKSEYDSSNF